MKGLACAVGSHQAPEAEETVKVRERLRIASGSQPASGSASINLHENNSDIVDRAAI